MNTLYLSLGSNIDPRIEFIAQAYKELERYGEIVKKSSYYRTEAWGFESESYFVNSCICWQTGLDPLESLRFIKKIELKLGRKKKKKEQIYSDRPIDIDIIFFNQDKIDHQELKVPHILYHQRNFVLVPLSEIAGDELAQGKQMTVKELMLKSCDRSQIVQIFT